MNLHKILFYSGLIIVIAGLIFLLASGLFIDVEKLEIAKSSLSWEATANLEERKTYILDVFSSTQWRDAWTDGGYEEPQPVDVVITSPNNNSTTLQAFFYALQPTSTWYKSPFPLIVYVEYKTVDSHSIEIDETSSKVRFTVQQSGYYTARLIESTLNWTIGTPREIVFYEEITENQGIYPVLFQSSAFVCLLIGSVVSVWGVKTTEKRIKRKRKVKK